MIFTKTKIPDVILIQPQVYEDERGHFFESFNLDVFKKNVGMIHFVQDNEAKSSKGVLRGLHYQLEPFAQSKLVRVVSGKVLDVAVDIRKDSPSFGKHVKHELNEFNKSQLFIPKGFAHGYVGLSDTAIVLYKVDHVYAKAYERGVRYNDPDLNIDWEIDPEIIRLSEKDANLPFLNEAETFL